PPSADTVWLRMGYTLESTATESRLDSSTAAIAARSPAPPPPITRMSCWYPLSPGIFRHSFLVKVAALPIVDPDGREVLHLDAANRFRPEVLVRHDLDLGDEAGQNGAGATDRPEVHRLVAHQRLLDVIGAVPLTHRALEPQLEQLRRVPIH